MTSPLGRASREGAPLRILHAISSDRFAGVEQFVRRLAIAQADAGHDILVVGGSQEHMRDALESRGIGFIVATRTQDVVHGVRSHARHLDIVNSHMTAADVGAVLGLSLIRARPALVATRHFAQRRGSRGPRTLYRAVERRVDTEMSISHAVADAIGVPSTIVHSGIEDRPLVPVERRSKTALIAQRLQPEKRTDFGIRAFAASGIAADGWALTIAGSGAELESLRSLADHLGVSDAVRFVGFRADIPALMDDAGLLIAPCDVEGLGLTVLEAMSGGLPVVAADASGHREVLAGLDSRSLFAPDDVDAAGDGLRSLADDVAGRAAFGMAARARQQSEFSLGAQVAATDAAYRAAIVARTKSATTPTPSGRGHD